MTNSALITAALYVLGIIALGTGTHTRALAQEAPINPCLDCHTGETPEVVQQWEAGKHSKTGVKCYVCHFAEEGSKEGVEHHDFFITATVDIATCESCHPENAAELLAPFSEGKGNHP